MIETRNNIEVIWKSVQAFSGTRKTNSLVAYPNNVEECVQVLEYAKKHGYTICVRGRGNSWADMILNNGQVILNTSRLNKILLYQKEAGEIIVQPGVTFSQVYQTILADCWSLPSTPGGMEISIGGAIGNNVHGKDSWRNGNFGDQVVCLKILQASGQVRHVDPVNDKEMFQGIVGSMGLLGIVTEITLKLEKVESPFVDVATIHTNSIDESLYHLEAAKSRHDYIWVWIDAFATGNSLGKGFVQMARWTGGTSDYDERKIRNSLVPPQKILGLLPSKPVLRVIRPAFHPTTVKIANKMMGSVGRVLSSINKRKRSRMLFPDYSFPFHKIPNFTTLYEPYGFFEFQPLVPQDVGLQGVKKLLHIYQDLGCEPLICGLKSHKKDENMISYSCDGYSLGGMFSARGREPETLEKIANIITRYTMDIGGKIYLAKDELLSRDVFEKMYPRYRDLLKLKQQIDPGGLFSSDMFRRLFVNPSKPSRLR